MNRIGMAVVLMGLLSIATLRADTPMNLLVIQTDEHNFRTLGCYRQTLPTEQAFVWGKGAAPETPAIDAIAKRGVICTSFYATSPVCTPSRASFFSGRYPQNTGSWQNDRPMDSNIVTFAEVLRRRGYATGYAGKWHLDGPGKPQWGPKRKFGFDDNRYMFNRGHWKKFELTKGGPRVAARSKNGAPSYNLNGADDQSFSTDWLTDRAIDFIRANASQPFCYHLSLPDPHGPNTVRPPYDAMYQDMPIRPPYTFGMTSQNPKWAPVSGKNSSLKFNAGLMATYFGMVRCIDDNVERLVATLDELGLTDNTAIVFTSDHGDLCFEHGRLNKGNPYEGSAKIPMIISAPGRLPAGGRVDQALGTVDFLPTILTLLDAELPAATEGRNAAELLRGQAKEWQDVAILRASSDKPTWVVAVTDRYKLVVSANEVPWLFDLQADPNELRNAFDDAQHDAVIKRLARALIDYGERTNDPQLQPGRLSEQLNKILQ
ncbi:MAG: sulfatase-like hydrolase/transferase [Planctomycetota bacterium]